MTRARERLLFVPPDPPPMSFAAYRAIKAINWSSLKHLSRSPAHYLAHMLAPDRDTAALKRGRAVHVAVLEPERFASLYSVWDGRRSGKDWEAFEVAERLAGREVLTTKEYELAKALAIAVRGDPVAARYVSGVRTEQSITWTHRRPEIEGLAGYEIACKARLDAVRDDIGISDLKTGRDGSPSAFGREVLRLEYHVQAAWYVDGLKAATGRELPWSWVVAESTAPHVVQVYRADADVLELGRERYRELLDLLHACTRDNHWPGYATSEMPIQLPKWAWPQDDDVEDLGLEFGHATQEESHAL